MKGRKLTSIVLACTLVVPLLAACSIGANTGEKTTERVLRIATSDGFSGDDEYFRMQYTNIFEYNHPNLRIEIINTRSDTEQYRYYNSDENSQIQNFKEPFDTMQELMEGDNPPDIVMMNYNQLGELLEKNLLAPLDSRIKKDKFDTTDYVPVISEGIKSLNSDGQFYALAPYFNSSALIYNKQIFTNAGAPFPHDHMMWEEVFALASRVSNHSESKPIYGFSFNTQKRRDAFNLLEVYTTPLQLRYFNEAVEHMTVDSDNWEQAWSKMYQLQQDGIIPTVQDPSNPRKYQDNLDEESPFPNDNFRLGNLAMTIMSYDQVRRLMDVNEHAAQIPNYTPIDWGVVTMPSHPEYPGVVPFVEMTGLMAINAKASNPEDAWNFIKFINGPEWAKLKSGTTNLLPAYQSLINNKHELDFNVKAFYDIKPSGFFENDYYNLDRINPNLTYAINPGSRELQKVMLGKQSARQGLKAWQAQGDAILRQIKANPNGPINLDQAQENY